MKISDCLKAVGVALATLVITITASFPMVAYYAYIIEPGHEQEFYVEAAQWIAPWSSHILGPITFFVFNYWLARKSPERNARVFALVTILAYLVIDLGSVPAMGGDITVFLTVAAACWIALKLAGAMLGAYLSERAQN